MDRSAGRESTLARNHARQCDFAICTRNAHAEWVQGPEAHRTAFIVGKIRDVLPCPPTEENDEGGKDRHLIQFSEYARVDIRNVWKGNRNPVKYSTLEELGIDPSSLRWEAMPKSARAFEPKGEVLASKSLRALTMADAKKGLAATLHVAPEAIEITIRG